MCIEDIAENFGIWMWRTNGPGVMTRTAEKLCENINTKSMRKSGMNCSSNFRILPVTSCYSIHYSDAYKFFSETDGEWVFKKLSDSVIAHVWNALSYKWKLRKDSKAAYVQLAKEFCPMTLAACDEF